MATTNTPTISRLSGGSGVTLFEEASQEGFVVGAQQPAKFTGDIYLDDAELEDLWSNLRGNTSDGNGGSSGGSGN